MTDDTTPNDPTTIAELWRLLAARLDATDAKLEALRVESADAWRQTAAHVDARVGDAVTELRAALDDTRVSLRSDLNTDAAAANARLSTLERDVAELKRRVRPQ